MTATFSNGETPSFAYVYDIATRGRLLEVDEAIAVFDRGGADSPESNVLRGVRAALSGDVPAAITLLRRAIDRTQDGERRVVIDILAPIMASRGDMQSVSDLLALTTTKDDHLEPGFEALRAAVAARDGRHAQSAALASAALLGARRSPVPTSAARAINRVALAAFYREDFSEARERALEAARYFEKLGQHRNASLAYTMMWAIAQDWAGDAKVGRFYAERIALSARRDRDIAMENYGLVAQLEIAVESGDHRHFDVLRARLLAQPLSEQYRERFPALLADVLSQFWSGRFNVAGSTLRAMRNFRDIGQAETRLCDALESLAAAAAWDLDTARRLSRRAIRGTTLRGVNEPLFFARRRRVARIVAAATCAIIGDGTRARRALSAAFDPDGAVARALFEGSSEGVAPLLHGYVRAIDAARAASLRARPSAGLTPAEVEVLRALPSGATLRNIAAAFGKSPKTIATQVESVYAKLNVSSRAAAIARARDLGICPSAPDADRERGGTPAAKDAHER